MAVPGDELAALCVELPELRAVMRPSPARWELLQQAVEAARRGEPLAEHLRKLGVTSLHDRGGAAEPADDGRKGSSAAPWDTGGGHSVDGVYVCPLGVCGRVRVRYPGDPLPVCHLHDRPLRFEPDR